MRTAHCAISFPAIQIGIITPEIQGTMDHPPETTHTETIRIPVPAMIMAQCREDTSMSVDRY